MGWLLDNNCCRLPLLLFCATPLPQAMLPLLRQTQSTMV
jgi:hypothetical protein